MRTKSDDDNPITPFAVTDFRHREDVFGIKKKDRRNHMYVIGKTGTGKSTLLKNMLIADIRRGEGLALIDPHGDLADDVLSYVPEARMEDVIYFNPMDTDYSIAFNPLEETKPGQRHLIVSDLISIFKKIWPEYWGPRLEHIMRYSLLTLLDYPGSTLLDLPRILTDKAFQAEVLKHVKDRHVNDFWRLQSGSKGVEAASPIINKTGQLIASPYIRYILGQSHNTFDLRKVMDEGKIIVVNLSKGQIGEDTSSLLGAMLVSKIMLAATSRADTPESQRKPFHLYVDEVQNFLTQAFANILSESRKYGLSLILAHQYIAQLDEKVRSAIFGNVGTIISFRAGAEDAPFLTREFQPVFDMFDLIALPNYCIYLKLMIDGATSKPFSARTLPPPSMTSSYKREIIEFSRVKYGRPRFEIDQEMDSTPGL
ncbi:MAG: type IV secretion system DNA-binding domain-containing protein [Armatimonadetes bacterium]|nr:type IV secretion system DNA-binding domain-containing protein [Armatimonadota bacterium]